MCNEMKDNKEYYRAMEMAEQQLMDALDMLEKSSSVSSLTLAGAAEEILGKIPPEIGSIAGGHKEDVPNVFEAFSSRIAHETGIDRNLIRKSMNKPRNTAKHYIQDHMENDGTFRISLGSVESMLIRCIVQYSIVVDQSSVPEHLKQECSRFLSRIIPTHSKQLNKDGAVDAPAPVS